MKEVTLVNLLYCFMNGVWRRWFGGGLDGLFIDNRFVQHLIGFCMTSGILVYNGYNLYHTFVIAGFMQGLFWARSHGFCFDYGHSKEPDVSRYEKIWWWKYVEKHVPDNMKYGYACDFVCMNARYTLPAILIGFIALNPAFMFAGMVVAGVYALMWACYDLGWTKDPTEWAEFLSGVLVGFLLVM